MNLLLSTETEDSNSNGISKEVYKGDAGSGAIEDFVTVPLNDLVMEIVEGMQKIKHATAPISKIMSSELRATTQKGNSISIFTNHELQNHTSDINEVKRLIRPSQVQLFMYILYCWRRERCNKFKLNLREYFMLRGIRRRKENVDRLYEDLAVLSALSVDILAKNKKQEYRITGNLLHFQREKDVHISLDSWINELSLTTYTLLNKQFFRYTASQNHSIMISLKLSQLMKVKSSKRNQLFRIKSNTLMSFLGIQDDQVKKQGFSYFHRLIENAFSDLHAKEGFNIAYMQQPNCHDEFMQTMIDYSHRWLYEYYQSLVYK